MNPGGSLAAKARLTPYLRWWRHQWLIHETEGDAEGISFDKGILDYYLDQYNELAAYPPACSAQGNWTRQEDPEDTLAAA